MKTMKKLCLMSFTVLLMAITMFACTPNDNTDDTTVTESEKATLDETVIETEADTEQTTSDILTDALTTEAPSTEDGIDDATTVAETTVAETTVAETTVAETTVALTTEEVTEPPVPLPTEVALPAAYSTADHEYPCDDDSVVYTFKNKTVADYTAACANYTELNFQVYSSIEQDKNRATTFVGQSVMAHVYWTDFTSELNIVLSDTAADTLPPRIPEVTDGDYVCSVTQIEDNSFIGMSYVIQLKDGSYIFYDGNGERPAKKMLDFVLNNYQGEGKPTVRAWIITHSHNDHYPGFEYFSNNMNNFGSKINLEHVIVSQLSDDYFSLGSGEGAYLSTKFWDDVANFKDTKVVIAHTGMKFKFCNLDMEVMFAAESIYKNMSTPADQNNACLVTRLYDEDYSALFLADTHPLSCAFLLSAYGEEYLRSDMCQVAHHGVSDNILLDLYDLVRAPIMWYPAAYSIYDSVTRYAPNIRWSLERRDYVKEILIQGVGQFTRTWGTTFDADAKISIPNYIPTNRRPDVPPEGRNLLHTDKTTYKQGEAIRLIAYGILNDWVGIVKKGETTPMVWWYMSPTNGYFHAEAGEDFDITKYRGNANGSVEFTPGEYTIVLVKDGKTLEEAEPAFSLDITITEGSADLPDDKKLVPTVHITFEGNGNDSCGNATVNAVGNIEYTDGYWGQGAIVGTNYFSIPGYDPGSDSFTISVWANISNITGDPALFATKDWYAGANKGFALGIRNDGRVHVNIGDSNGHRVDKHYAMGADFLDTWVNYTMVVDRFAGKLKLSVNFGEFQTVDIPNVLINAPFEGLGQLVIGQDATGKYGAGSMTCIIDEFMIFDRALNQEELAEIIKITDGSADIPDDEEKLDPTVHITFEGNGNDSCGNATVNAVGNIEYTDGYWGQGAIVGTNYFSIPGYDPGSDSFTISVWANISDITGDPALFATKDWYVGANKGFALGIRNDGRVHVNIGDSNGHRVDKHYAMGADFLDTWVNYTMVVDRFAGKLKLSVNFGEFQTVDIPNVLINAPFEGLGQLVIGQDATGKYRAGSMTAVVDEFMIFDRALNTEEIAELAAYFEK